MHNLHIKHVRCLFEEPPVKTLKAISMGFLDIILDNTHRVFSKEKVLKGGLLDKDYL